MNRVAGLCGAVVAVFGLAGCGSNTFGSILEGEGIAAPAGSTKASPQDSPSTAKGFPKDNDAPTAMPDLDGRWESNLAQPLVFQQVGDGAWARFDNGGRIDCRWNGKSRYNCVWVSDEGKGIAQIWQKGDGLVGHMANNDNLRAWAEIELGPWTRPVVIPVRKEGECWYDADCDNGNTHACIKGECVAAFGRPCVQTVDCPLSHKYHCANKVCMPN